MVRIWLTKKYSFEFKGKRCKSTITVKLVQEKDWGCCELVEIKAVWDSSQVWGRVGGSNRKSEIAFFWEGTTRQEGEGACSG